MQVWDRVHGHIVSRLKVTFYMCDHALKKGRSIKKDPYDDTRGGVYANTMYTILIRQIP